MVFFRGGSRFLGPSGGMFSGRHVVSLLGGGNVTLCSATSTIHHLRSGTSSGFLRIMRRASVDLLLGRVPVYGTVMAAKRGTASVVHRRVGMGRPIMKADRPFRFRSQAVQLCEVPSSDHTCPLPVRGGSTVCRIVFGRLNLLGRW